MQIKRQTFDGTDTADDAQSGWNDQGEYRDKMDTTSLTERMLVNQKSRFGLGADHAEIGANTMWYLIEW